MQGVCTLPPGWAALQVDWRTAACRPGSPRLLPHVTEHAPPLPFPPPTLPSTLQDILFYQLPEHPEFYSELLNLVEEGEGGETPTGGWGRVQAGGTWHLLWVGVAGGVAGCSH